VIFFGCGEGPSYLGSNFEDQNQSKPFLGFSAFSARVSVLILHNFLDRFEGLDQGLKTASSAEKLGQHRFLEDEFLQQLGIDILIT